MYFRTVINFFCNQSIFGKKSQQLVYIFWSSSRNVSLNINKLDLDLAGTRVGYQN